MHEKSFRNQVSWMMFLLSVLVIWVHSYNADLFAAGLSQPLLEQTEQIENLVSVGIGQAAVPGFFMLSSYLFFRGFCWQRLGEKWKSRFYSILLPYVVWNLLYYLGYVLATGLPAVRTIVGREPVLFTAAGVLEAVLHYSYAPVFWYLYQLIFLILLSPIIYFFVKNKITGILFLSALFLAVHLGLDTQKPNTDALAYYAFAAYMALHCKGISEGAWSARRVLAAAAGLTAAGICSMRMGEPGVSVIWTVFYRLLIPVSVWALLDGERLPKTRPWMRQSLFLYAVHYVIVRTVNKGAAIFLLRVAGEQALMLSAVGLYILMPAVALLASYGMALFLSRWLPGIWKILSGGRNL